MEEETPVAKKTEEEIELQEIEVNIIGNMRSAAKSNTAKHLIKKHNFITIRDNNTLLIYKEGYYQDIARSVIAEEVKKIWKKETATHIIKEIISAHIIPQTYIEREEVNNHPNLTCLKNGILNLETGELQPHTPQHYFTFQLPINHNPDAICEKFETFLKEVTEDETDIYTILQLIGYCLWRDYPTAKVFVLLGAGRNGKSVLMNVIKEFLGEKNVRGMSMHQLEHDHFSTYYLFSRHANMNPDISNKRINTSGTIKKLTGNDLLDCNVKHSDYATFRNFAKLIFAANELPSSDDSTSAWLERWIFLKFPHKFNGDPCPHCHVTHEVKKNLIDELTTEEELSGILNLITQALITLRNNNWDFTLSEKAKGIEKEYARLSDTSKAFIDDMIILDENGEIEKGELYSEYAKYAKNVGDDPMTTQVFSQRLKQHVPEVRDKKGTKGRRFWVGIKILETVIQGDFRDNEDGWTT
jgi:putative DNA primase/helicase